MTMASESAQQYLIDPLTAPNPSEETGPGSHFRSTFAPQPQETHHSPPSSAAPSQIPTNPFHRSSLNEHGSVVESGSRASHPSPPTSASPRTVHFSPSYRTEALPVRAHEPSSPRHSKTRSRGMSVGEQTSPKHGHTRSRGNSLSERFPGDQSHQPLRMLKHDTKVAHRSPHLQKRHIPGPDSIDRLDSVLGAKYHHEGPFDAALLSRNMDYETSPLAALAGTNEEALKATPHENVLDALEKHRPLEGTAAIPPGHEDRFGRRYDYEEKNVMTEEGGDYKRWPGVDYASDDHKGKGEPFYSLEQSLREQKLDDGVNGAETTGIEMSDRSGKRLDPRDPVEIAGGQQNYSELEQDTVRRSGSKSVSEGLKKRIGSLRRKQN